VEDRQGRVKMGTVFKKRVTKAMPAGAETFERKGEQMVRWRDRRGKTRTARPDAERRMQPGRCWPAWSGRLN
jgi:hypothetical protein